MKYYLSFVLIRLFTLPMVWLPYRVIHRIGKALGTVAYYVLPTFRKRVLCNLALVKGLDIDPERVAKESFQNLMISCLEFPKLGQEKDLSRIAHCENPEIADQIRASGKSVIFFCGHQANWEILFLEGSYRMPGVAIGRPIKNTIMYEWVLSIRQRFGGKIITPQNAIREGLRALRNGSFLGIVGDQGMPDSGYSSDFFGRLAWTSPVPALLSYRTGNPIMVATTRREKGKYYIHYSDPIWPNAEESQESEIKRMMTTSLAYLEESIRQNPGQWLWQHNRWKQQPQGRLKTSFRHESICVILPRDFELDLSVFRKIYPTEFFTLMMPVGSEKTPHLADAEVIYYNTLNIKDLKFKLIFNFTKEPIHSKYVFKTIKLSPYCDLSEFLFKKALVDNAS